MMKQRVTCYFAAATNEWIRVAEKSKPGKKKYH